MRIGILNSYWSTRGGGERYAGTLAEILSQKHTVDLVGPDPVDLSDLASHLALDLTRTCFRTQETRDPDALRELTAEYDVLLNTSFGSRQVSQAKKSIYFVFFPHRVFSDHNEARLAGFRNSLGAILEHPIRLHRGFYEPEAGQWCWTGPKATIRIARRAFKRGRVTLTFKPFGPGEPTERITEIRAPGARCHLEDDAIVIEHTGGSDPIQLELTCQTFRPDAEEESVDTRDLGVCLDLTELPGSLLPIRRGMSQLSRLDAFRARRSREFLRSYDKVVAISRYTQGWIEKMWGVPSSVLAPPVDTDMFLTPNYHDKDKYIVSVGRFFAGSHNKNHIKMLKVFRRMVDRKLIPEGWQLQLIGNVHRNRIADLEYIADVTRLAEGYPVRLSFDLPFDHLVRAYQRASILWHAAGWGQNPHRAPEKLEHFGLTTCEAMSAGCVPVVFAKAGQLEVVERDQTGFHFLNERQLTRHTQRLVAGHGQPWLNALRTKVVKSVQRYGKTEFATNLEPLIYN